jgi:MFS family permease
LSRLKVTLLGLMARLPPALQLREFRLVWFAMLAGSFATQMVAVAVGWQVYSLHHRPLDLGLIGLAEFLPLPLLALPAGALADRFSRRLIFAISVLIELAVALLLLVVSATGVHALWPYLALAAMTGIAGAIGSPAARAIPPSLVPTEHLASAMALRSVAGQIAVVSGPAVGGFLFVLSSQVVYAVATVLFAASFLCVVSLRQPGFAAGETVAGAPAPRLAALLGGIRLIRRTPTLLGAITLDLFAVLFGGAVALLPVFAQSVLHTGPIGLGILRSAPAVGALTAAAMLTRRPLGRHAGRTLLVVVGVFGVSIVTFGLSHSFVLSLVALGVSGFADAISVNIRATTVALVTPDALRGRVTAVEMVFISASNELGAFESGLAASLVGTVPAVVAGGIATIFLALIWPRLFPSIATIDRMEDLRPVAA